MDEKDSYISSATKVLSEYGINVSGSEASVEIVSELTNTDAVSLIVTTDTGKYFIAADDVLMDDSLYLSKSRHYGISQLTPVPLLKSSPDDDYVTMFDSFMVCKVFKVD